MKREFTIILTAAIIAIVIGSGYAASRYLIQPTQTQTGAIQIVAAQNFWGSLVSQLGGTHVSVTSIVTNPNTDPHEYESNAADARAIADARYVIVNGAGYDSWASRLIAANNSPNQKVLTVADLLGKKEGDNPHFWYSPTYVNETVHQMYADLVSIDSADSSYYKQQYSNLNASLGEYNNRINEINQKFANTPVASTESIFEYLATAAHLNLISPPEFMKAVAEGNDPSPADIATFQSELINGTMPGNATILVYNLQTVTPVTIQLKEEAASHNIPIVGVTETIQPSDVSFETWMNAELIQLQNALNANALGSP
jgi:zinc/manganese transport system substrate-binding protein